MLVKEKNEALQEALMPKLDLEHSASPNVAVVGNPYQGHDLDFNNQDNPWSLRDK